MKKNHKIPKPADLQELYQVLASLKSPQECEKFMQDLCAPCEIHAMSDRWKVAQKVAEETPYHIISRQLIVGMSTIVRVAHCYNTPDSGYKMMLKRLQK